MDPPMIEDETLVFPFAIKAEERDTAFARHPFPDTEIDDPAFSPAWDDSA